MPAATKKPFQVAIMFSGRASNFNAVANYFQDKSKGVEIVLALTDNPQAPGIEVAAKHNIPCQVLPRDNQTSKEAWFNQLASVIEQYSPDLIVLAGFMRVLSAEFINRFPDRIINIHPSLLPAFCGLNAQAQALKAGAKISGCTVHYVLPEVDAGPIIAQASVPVLPDDTPEKLADRILVKEHQLLPMVIEQLARQSNP